MPATIAAQPKQPARPVAPMPLWERERLFREPDYPPGFEALPDGD